MRTLLLVCLIAIIQAGAVGAAAATVVNGEDGSVCVAGVPGLDWDTGKWSTFLGSLEASLAPSRHPYSYTDLMGFSGMAFIVRWGNDGSLTKWGRSGATGEMPEQMMLIEKLTGWKLDGPVTGIQRPRDNEKLRKAIVGAIDSGTPVLTYPDNFDVAVIFGYSDDGKTALIQSYYEPHVLRMAVDKLGNLQMWPDRYTSPPTREQCLRQSLETAVNDFYCRADDAGLAGRGYWYGYSALAQWSADVRRYSSMDAETRKKLEDEHPFVLDTLWYARRDAVIFLNNWAAVAGGSAGDSMKRAAEKYEHEVEALEPALKASDWSENSRERIIKALDQSRALESTAIAEMQKALLAMRD